MLGARHQRVQRLRRLLRRASYRETEHAFVAEGLKVVEVALESGAPVETVFVVEGSEVSAPQIARLVEATIAKGARVFHVSPEVMGRVSDTVTPQPVCAVIGAVDRTLQAFLRSGSSAQADIGPAAEAGSGSGRLLLVCVDVRDPGNLGALMRAAAAAGASAVVCTAGTVDAFNPKTVRASAGSVFLVPIVRGGDAAEALQGTRKAGYRIVGTSARGGVDYAAADWTGDVALVLGNEANGLPAELMEQLDEAVSIPMALGSESLNVAMTATVICFEVARQRRLDSFGSNAPDRPLDPNRPTVSALP